MNVINTLSYLYYAGMALVFLGTFMGISRADGAAWVLALGTAPVLGVRFYNRLVSSSQNLRLHSILVVSSLFLALSAVLLFAGRNYWIVGVLIAAVLDTYTTFRRWK